ncbi:MAG TPA: transporter substrate-binding domain-containing protein [Synergistales bacterium]|nr:transporter substrate-binding domain-containing protein [Synergistales bacterium]
MKKTVLVSFLIFLLVFPGCLYGSSVLSRNFILVGTEPNFRPFSFRSHENSIVGLDLDLVRMIGARLGKEVRIVEMPFSELVPSLLMKKIDLAASGIAITPDRAGKMLFSDIYYSIPDAVVTRAGDTSIRSSEDLQGRTAAVLDGMTRERFLSAMDNVHVSKFQKIVPILREVLYCRADFGLVDHTVARAYLSHDSEFQGKLKISFLHRDMTQGMALGVLGDDPEFLLEVNRAIHELRQQGVLEMLEKKWLEDRTLP